MGIKITELPSTTVKDADYIPVANASDGTRKVLMEDVLNQASPPLDTALSPTSDNAVKNKVIAAAVNTLSVGLTNAQSGIDTVEKTALKAFPTDTATGTIASFTDGADGVPVKSLVVNIEPVQSGSGDPSPDNVRPITGWTGAKVTRTGKNLLPNEAESTTVKGVTFTVNDDGSVTVTGTATADVAFDISTVALKEGDYILSGCPAGGTLSSYCLALQGFSYEIGGGQNIRVPANDAARRAYILIRSGQTVNNLVYYPMIRIASDADATYAPYHGDTYSIDLGGTRYGGTLDLTTGKLTVDRVSELLANKTWTYFTRYNYPFFRIELPNSSGERGSGIVSDYQMISGYYADLSADHTVCIYSASNKAYLCIRDDTYTDAATFRSAMTSVQLVYELATPVTYQLTPQEVTTLLGTNNIWADCGPVDVTYRADTGLYIDKLTGSTEADMVADAPIASGKYFFVGNTLYLSTTAIAAGATLTPGTNCIKTTLAEALNNLNS